MSSSAQLRQWWAPYKCAPGKMVKVAFPGDGRTWNLPVAAEAVPLWEQFAQLMTDHDYLFRESAGGTYNCRRISGTLKYSLHSYGTAVDLNPSKNPYKRPLTHDYPQAFINDVLAVTSYGKQAFRWGGSWRKPDAMHWEINVAPSDIDQNMGAEEFWQNVYDDLQKLKPTTDETWARTLIEDYRERKAEE